MKKIQIAHRINMTDTKEDKNTMDGDFEMDLTDCQCSFHPILVGDAPAAAAAATTGSSSTAFRSPVGAKAAWECGKHLKPGDVISLVFLLVSDVDNALKVCRAVEEGRYPEPVGPHFMRSLVDRARAKNLVRWDVKLACALHLIRKYKVRHD